MRWKSSSQRRPRDRGRFADSTLRRRARAPASPAPLLRLPSGRERSWRGPSDDARFSPPENWNGSLLPEVQQFLVAPSWTRGISMLAHESGLQVNCAGVLGALGANHHALLPGKNSWVGIPAMRLGHGQFQLRGGRLSNG